MSKDVPRFQQQRGGNKQTEGNERKSAHQSLCIVLISVLTYFRRCRNYGRRSYVCFWICPMEAFAIKCPSSLFFSLPPSKTLVSALLFRNLRDVTRLRRQVLRECADVFSDLVKNECLRCLQLALPF